MKMTDNNKNIFNCVKNGDAESLAKHLAFIACDPNSRDENGDTLLTIAAANGHLDCVKLLIDCHASVNEYNNDGTTALMWAAREGHADCVDLLVDSDADLNLRDSDGATALMWADCNGHTVCAKLLRGEIK